VVVTDPYATDGVAMSEADGWAAVVEEEEGYDQLAPPGVIAPAVFRHEIEDDTPDIPPQVARYLKGDERRVIFTRQHEAVLILPAVILLAGLAAAIAVNVAAYHHPPVVHVAWWAFLAAAAWSAWKWQEWRAGWFVITADRLIVIEGLISRRVNMLPYSKLRDIEVSQTIPGRLLGYGRFECESLGTDRALHTVDRIPDPDVMYRRVCELIMPASGRKGPG
jgi:membrane protein YdbS with pleckstrin-like domain